MTDSCTTTDLDALIRHGKTYSVILADPPWMFHTYSGKGKIRSAERHYDTMTLDMIKALPVEQLAAPDCALFLWAVWPELPGALDVIAAWGFAYKTVGFVWVKTSRQRVDPGAPLHTGMGYWTRANTEACLFAIRGNPHREDRGVHQVIMSPVGKHSRKPQETHRRIERLMGGPYLELFGRQPMPGWTVWGNDIERGLFHSNIPELCHVY